MTALLSGALLTCCNDAEYSIRENSIYFAGATSTKSVNVAMETSGADVSVVVRLAKAAEQEITVSLDLNSQLLDAYNAENFTEYQLVPPEHYDLPNPAQVTIPAGEFSATLKVHIENFDTQGKLYAMPFVLTKVLKGDITLSATQSKLIYLIAKPLITTVPVMKGYGSGATQEAVKLAPDTEDWELVVEKFTIECWVRMSAYTKNNQCIFSNWANSPGGWNDEFYVRFGDANSPYNYMQVKAFGHGGIQGDRDLVANTWYHWAYVWDPPTFYIYRNAEVYMKVEPPMPLGGAALHGPSGSVHFPGLDMIGSGATYFPDLCAMSQVRFWKTARTQAQIRNNMYFEVDPTNPELVVYLPMNEDSGNVFHDITGNGHDATAGAHIIQTREQNVRFDR